VFNLRAHIQKLAVNIYHYTPTGDFLQDMSSLHEVEYKYHIAKSVKFEGHNPKRRANILFSLKSALDTLIKSCAGQLLGVFDNWLSDHALTSPQDWAEARVRMLDSDEFDYLKDDENDSKLEMIPIVFYGPIEKRYKNRDEESYRLLRDAIDSGLPETTKFIHTCMKSWNSDMKDSEKENDEVIYYKDVDDFFYSIFSDYETMKYFLRNTSDDVIRNVTKEILANEIFPVWYAIWSKKGINETKKRIEQSANKLRMLASGRVTDTSMASAELNAIMNVEHQTGSMMDYVKNELGVNRHDLDGLSNVDPAIEAEWHRDLLETGFNPEYEPTPAQKALHSLYPIEEGRKMAWNAKMHRLGGIYDDRWRE
jgi:hypothetical protein